MPRVTKSVTARAKHKKVLSATKGHYGARSRLFKTAKQSNIKSLQYAFRDRKNRKRSFRALWISRINAASRALGTSYSKLINGMATNHIIIDAAVNNVDGQFLIDTGASNSCIDLNKSEKFKLDYGKSDEQASSATNEIKETYISKKNLLLI